MAMLKSHRHKPTPPLRECSKSDLSALANCNCPEELSSQQIFVKRPCCYAPPHQLVAEFSLTDERDHLIGAGLLLAMHLMDRCGVFERQIYQQGVTSPNPS